MCIRDSVLAVRAVEDEEPAVAACLRQQLARLAVDRTVEEHGRLRGIPVVRVVRRRLEVPDQLSGVGIERDDRLGEQVVALPLATVDHRLGVTAVSYTHLTLPTSDLV